MASIDKLRASDGSGNASVATVQNSRSPGSSTIVVDTVAGINDNFMGSMGTPHTFVDPITSETITVISEATCVDFSGHVDGSNLEIDDIAPGQTDLGSEVDDIIIIRPTTQWSDEVADVLDVAHNDDGTAKDLSIDYNALTLNLKQGWISAAEAWTYTSWDSTNKTGVVAVPTGAASRYSLGMKVRFTQSTGGTKYGIITKIATTALTIYFGTDYTLNNEAITVPFYSSHRAPFGFPMDPDKWSVVVTSSTSRSTTSTTFASLTDGITVPIGLWRLWYKTGMLITLTSTPASRRFCTLILSSSAAEEDANLTAVIGSRIPGATDNDVEASAFRETIKNYTAATALLLYGKVSTTGPVPTFAINTDNALTIKAICAYL